LWRFSRSIPLYSRALNYTDGLYKIINFYPIGKLKIPD
jgi:hypothetical protein